MKKISILHIASFSGNIGDNASHMGFSNILNEIIPDHRIDRLEIRKAYAQYKEEDKLIFDENFSKRANLYDLVVFGGGGFLDYWVEGSSTGCTIDIDLEVLREIKTPILISSVGCNPHRAIPDGNKEKFQRFLNEIISNKNITLAVRNDGSMNTISREFGSVYVENIVEILDHGFFYTITDKDEGFNIDQPYACINITTDQIEMYNEGNFVANVDAYYKEIAAIVDFLIESKKLKVVFVPHISSDIAAISELLNYLKDPVKRESIVIAPLKLDDSGANFNFNIYKKSELIIGSRYHANVCSIAFGKKTFGLSPLSRIEYVHNKLNMEKSFSYLSKGFSSRVIADLQSLSFNSNVLNVPSKLEEYKASTLSFYKQYFYNSNLI